MSEKNKINPDVREAAWPMVQASGYGCRRPWHIGWSTKRA